jgi:hypothetical protein
MNNTVGRLDPRDPYYLKHLEAAVERLEKSTVNDFAFRALLNLVMCSDPSPVSPDDDKAIRDCLDEESKRRGFSDWIDAYHRFKPNAGSMIAINV